MTVGELLARADSRELTEWQAYEREFGPLGPERGDFHAAQVAHVVATTMGGGKKKPKLQDFIPRWSRPKQRPADHLNIFRALAARQEGQLGNDR